MTNNLSIHQSLTGRVRNFNLPATADNCMMPVYEAISNALFAIQEKYTEDWPDKGIITIEVVREKLKGDDGIQAKKEMPVVGFIISDNGIGLNNTLFGCFKELDTEYRADKKGRGIGRLSWLKVFENTSVISVYLDSSGIRKRSFSFQLSNLAPFTNYSDAIVEVSIDTGTIVQLNHYKDIYYPKAPLKPEDIKKKILGHFISIFAQTKRLKINLIDGDSETNLSDYFYDSIVGDSKIDTITLDQGEAQIQHLLIPKKLAPIGNSLIYCAADRSVISNDINDALGLKHFPNEEHGSLIYLGLCSGDLFDAALNHERTGFNFGDIDFEEVNKIILEKTKYYLDVFLEEKREKNKNLLKNLLESNPMYSSGIPNIEEYIEKMPLNWDETKLVQDVALKRHRAKKALSLQIDKLDSNAEKMDEYEFHSHVAKITESLGDTEKSSLAQYVVERKMVIELLQNLRKRNDRGKHGSEARLHEVICPLGVTNEIINYDDHNLWLIDDRLAYYSFIASDRPIKTFAKGNDNLPEDEQAKNDELAEIGHYSEKSEPDIALLNYPALFKRKNTADPVVIIEFKSAGKVSYSGSPSDNPVVQIRKYIETLQAKKCYDHEYN